MNLNNHHVDNWKDFGDEEISIEAVKKIWPVPDFLVSKIERSPTDWTSVLEIQGPRHIVLMIKGIVKVHIQGISLTLRPGNYFTINKGEQHRYFPKSHGNITMARVVALSDLAN